MDALEGEERRRERWIKGDAGLVLVQFYNPLRHRKAIANPAPIVPA